MNDVEYECPACGQFGYDLGYSCRRCGYNDEHGITPEVRAKLDALARPEVVERRQVPGTTDVHPQAPTPSKVTFHVAEPLPLNRSFASPTQFMVQRDHELKLAREQEIQRSQRTPTASDMRGGFGLMPPEVTLTREQFLSSAINSLVSAEAPRRVHAVLLDDLERYWERNLWGHIPECIDIEYKIAAYLNTLPREYRRRSRRADGDGVAKVLVEHSRTGLEDTGS